VSRCIHAFFADTHGGHRLGLLQPGTVVYDEGPMGSLMPREVTLTATQEFLWEAYTADIDQVVALADGDPIYVWHNGDLTQGVKHKASLVSTRTADQVTIAVENMRPWLDIENVVRLEVVIGTAAHLLGEASTPIMVVQQLQAAYPRRTIELCYHHRPTTVDGIIFDVAHHGPSSGIREWTQGNQLRYYAKSLVIHDVMRGRRPPHMIFRAHFHRLWAETIHYRINDWLVAYLEALEALRATRVFPRDFIHGHGDQVLIEETEIVLLPCYVGMGEYGRQASGSASTLSVGTVAVEVIDGDLVRPAHYFEREIDLRREEIL